MDAERNLIRDGEIFGVLESTNGRSRSCHQCCGEHLKRDDVIRLVPTTVPVEGALDQAEDFIVAVLISDGTETCRVGFLPRRLAKHKRERCLNKFAQIIELYEDMEEAVYKRKSKRNNSVASFRLLDDIPRFE